LIAAVRKGPKGAPVGNKKLVALVTRVSTDRQASNPEGSLKTQLQRLRAHLDYKNATDEEDWVEVGVYELKGISGKVSMGTEEYAQIFADIRAGRVNTILCAALERLCRSVKDFLWFFEFINEYGVEFVCLKQKYDTTTPQGKLFVTIMIALAEFEREQTSERTRDAVLARAERGLWNGGQLLGYDLDANRKGYLVPNDDEVTLVNFVFEKYLALGSLVETTAAVNARGYRTKAYTSRRGQVHAGAAFNLTSIQYLLKNPAYIGKKEVNKAAKSGGQYQLVDAVWSGIIDPEKFAEAQRLLAVNSRTRHNGAATVRHVYPLSEGILHCGRCQTRMEGRSGTGRLGKTYFYYVCRNKECGLRVSAEEIEDAVIGRIAAIAQDPDLLHDLVAATNARLQRHAPALTKRQKALKRSLLAVKVEADKIMAQWAAMEGTEARPFLTEKLTDLGQRRADLERGLRETEDALTRVAEQGVSAESIRHGLGKFDAVYACLKPYEQKELVRLVLHRAEVGDRKIVLEINGGIAGSMPLTQNSRFGIPNWLPGEDSNLEPSG
jgi:site-specific DNA recombinase